MVLVHQRVGGRDCIHRGALVVRADLDMGRGKIAAQVAHAAWLADGQPKVVLRVTTEQGLLDLARQAGEAGLPVQLIHDAGRTQAACRCYKGSSE